MAVHTPDDIEKILEDDDDGSNNASSDALETGCSNPVDPGLNFDNVLQIFQNPQVLGFLRGLMTHQAAQN